MKNTVQEKPSLFVRFFGNLLIGLFSVFAVLFFTLVGTGCITGIVYLCKLCYRIIFG